MTKLTEEPNLDQISCVLAFILDQKGQSEGNFSHPNMKNFSFSLFNKLDNKYFFIIWR